MAISTNGVSTEYDTTIITCVYVVTVVREEGFTAVAKKELHARLA
jgi:hypothetical protein